MSFRVRVPTGHCFQGYDTKEKFIGYWHQTDKVLKTNPEKVVEIGLGNKRVSNYLENQGIEVVTADMGKGPKSY